MSPELIDSQEVPSRTTYPWDEWCDGNARKFVQGTDFTGDIDEFRNRFYNAKNRRADVVAVHTHKVTEYQGIDGEWHLVGPNEPFEGRPIRQALTAQFVRA